MAQDMLSAPAAPETAPAPAAPAETTQPTTPGQEAVALAEEQISTLTQEGEATPEGEAPGVETPQGEAPATGEGEGTEEFDYNSLVSEDFKVGPEIQATLHKALGTNADMVIAQIHNAIEVEETLGYVPPPQEVVAAVNSHVWLQDFATTLEKEPAKAVENLLFMEGDGGRPGPLSDDGMRYVEGMAAVIPQLPGPAFAKLTAAVARDLLGPVSQKAEKVKAYWDAALKNNRTVEAEGYAADLIDLEATIKFLKGLEGADKKGSGASPTSKDPEVLRMKKELEELRKKQEEGQQRQQQQMLEGRENAIKGGLNKVWEETTAKVFEGLEGLPGVKVAAKEALKGAILQELRDAVEMRVRPHLEAYRKTGTESHLEKATKQYATLVKMLAQPKVEKIVTEFGLKKVAASQQAAATAAAAAAKVGAPTGAGAPASSGGEAPLERQPGESWEKFSARLANQFFK